MLGLGPVGLVAGIVIGGAIGIIATWVGKALEDLIGTSGANSVMGKLFGKEKEKHWNQKVRDAQDADEERQTQHTLGLLRADPTDGVGQNAEKLRKAYAIAAKELGIGMGKYDASASVLASKRVGTGMWGGMGYGAGDLKSTDKEEQQFLRLDFQRKKILELERERDALKTQTGSTGGMNIFSDSSSRSTINSTPDNAFPNLNGGMIDSIA